MLESTNQMATRVVVMSLAEWKIDEGPMGNLCKPLQEEEEQEEEEHWQYGG